MASRASKQLNRQVLHPEIKQAIRKAEPANMAAKRHYKKAHAKREKRILLIGTVLATIFLVQLLVNQVKLHAANVTLTATQTRLTAVKKTNTNLKAEAKRLKDATYLQQILRDKYGYTKEGEIIYNLPSETE